MANTCRSKSSGDFLFFVKIAVTATTTPKSVDKLHPKVYNIYIEGTPYKQKGTQSMKADKTTKLYRSLGVEENHFMVNRAVKAVIINFGDERGDIIVKNDNYGTDRKYADFTKGKEEAGLHPMQIVFSGLETAIRFKDRYIGADDQVHTFGEWDADR